MVKKPISKKAAPSRATISSRKSEEDDEPVRAAAPAPRLMATVSSATPASRTIEPVRAAEPVRTVSAASNSSASSTSAGSSSASSSAGQQAGGQPGIRILGQYLKDLSFENPNAPQSLQPQGNQPDINISVNVNANGLSGNDFEVELQLEAKATGDGKTLFATEVLYAGIFKLENFPPNLLHAAVLIECPRMLFPFARQILADATRNGGFPPLMLDPIDFTAMYQQRMRQSQTATV